MNGLIQITWWSAKRNNIKDSLFRVHLHFPFNYVTQGREMHHKHCKTLFV